jgi:hypothetical protein
MAEANTQNFIDIYLYSHNSKNNQVIFRQLPVIPLILIWNLSHVVRSISESNTTKAGSSHIIDEFLELSNLIYELDKKKHITLEKNEKIEH